MPSAAAIFIRLAIVGVMPLFSILCMAAGERPARCASCGQRPAALGARTRDLGAQSSETVRSMLREGRAGPSTFPMVYALQARCKAMLDGLQDRHVASPFTIRHAGYTLMRRVSRGEVRDDPASGEGHRALRHVREGVPGRQGGAGRDGVHVHAHRALRGVGRAREPAHHHARAAQGVQDAPGPVRARRADGVRHAAASRRSATRRSRATWRSTTSCGRSSTRAAPCTPAGSRPARCTASRRTC